MAHASLKLTPGVDVIRTPALNEASISSASAIRYMPDQQGNAYPQKLGGWTRFFPNALGAIGRELWAWQDTNHVDHLAVGCETAEDAATNGAPLYVITEGSQKTITPRVGTLDDTPMVETVTTSNVAIVTAPGSGITSLDTVFVCTHIAVGGIIVFGSYPCTLIDDDHFSILLLNKLGQPLIPASNDSGGAVALFSTTVDLSEVTVTLVAHGYSVGNTYPCLVSTEVGGVTLLGNYLVRSVIDADNFTIIASNQASSTTTGSINGGDAHYIFWYGVGPTAGGGGFGVGPFGAGPFGAGVSGSATLPGDPVQASDWSLDSWGDVLIACPSDVMVSTDTATPKDGAIYTYNPIANDYIASVIPEAPSANDGIFVAMPQRQIVAYGSTFNGIQDQLLIRHCDVNNYNQWIALPTNQAGSFRIPRGSRIVRGMQVAQQGLLWTDIGLWAMQYVGPSPGVTTCYSYNEIGIGCGLISKKAVAALNNTVYWMGQTQFFTLSGDGVASIPCPIWDVIFQNLDTTNIDKIRCGANSQFSEITWYYPSASGGGEVDAYVKLNTVTGTWDMGGFGRTAWLNESVLGPPIACAPNKLVYQHETSIDADGAALTAYFQTGYFALSDGEQMIFVDEWWPDLKWGYYGGIQNATVKITFYTTNYPGDTPRVRGPYIVTQATQFISPRFRARLMAVRIESDDVGSWWRLGNPRYRYSADGKY